MILRNPKVFNIHIKISEESGIPHFSLFKRDRIIGQEAVSKIGQFDILHARYGGAPFNFFLEGIDVVGGFDISFAKVCGLGTQNTATDL